LSDPHAPPSNEPALLAARDITLAFGPKVIQRDLSFDVRRGSIFAVMGGSGCGKSTVLKSMIGLLRPRTGLVLVYGEDYWAVSERRRAEIGRQSFCVLFQNSALWSGLTVGMNVALPMQMFTRLDEESIRRLVMLKLSLVGMEHAVDLLPAELSGGMRKRAGLARALALDPPLLFLDEPTAGLDPIGAAAFDHLIRTLQQALGLTVFLITHDLDTLYAICDRVAVLADRRILAVAPVAELERLPHPWVQEYFTGPRGRAARDARRDRAPSDRGEDRGRWKPSPTTS
jgi:phospholipid/cholesterol/gamma-HCH transport system ATP-binding protein